MEHRDIRDGDILPVQVRLWKPDFRDKVNVCIYQRTVGMGETAVNRLEFTKQDADGYIQPCLTLNAEQCQQMMDDLWNCGIRPTEGAGSAGAMKAVQNHLADMKKILFHKLGIKE